MRFRFNKICRYSHRPGSWTSDPAQTLLRLSLVCFAVALFVGNPAKAEQGEPQNSPSVGWKVSIGAFVASQVADAATSYGWPEANWLYGRKFGARGIALKAGITAGVILAERALRRRHPESGKALEVFNFAASGVTARTVIYNVQDMVRSQPMPIGILPGFGTINPPR